ncbi:MAG: hypothetical protein FD177_1708 [Desulfovibrionaceae bacterium]|nr:MAG: hypothetical protein FD177_1708 [Desulfovibrionaceae bacterium]
MPLTESSQTTTVTGTGNITVQVVGSGNTLSIGASFDLQLILPSEVDFHKNLAHQHQLDPTSEFIEYVGQENIQSTVTSWLDSDKLVYVLAVKGRGGAGKTRLALKTCRDSEKMGWSAGFIRRAEAERMMAHMNFAGRGWDKDTLIVFDYAMAFDKLSTFLQQLADNQSLERQRGKTDPVRKLRVMLLEREATLSGGWLKGIIPNGHGSGRVLSLFHSPPVLELLPLQSVEMRRQVMARTLENLGGDVVLPEPGCDPSYEHWLNDMSWAGDPLYLMMAAMFVHERGLSKALNLEWSELVYYIADEELKRVARLAGRDRDRNAVLKHLTAFATLCGGLGADDQLKVIREECFALGRESCGSPADLRDLLTQALPGLDDGVCPIQPDLIGEAVILKALGEGKAKQAKEALLRAYALCPREVQQCLVRMVQDFESVDVRCVNWLKSVAAESGLNMGELGISISETTAVSQLHVNFKAKQDFMQVGLPKTAGEQLRGEVANAHLGMVWKSLPIYLASTDHLIQSVEPLKEEAELHKDLTNINRNVYLAVQASSPKKQAT